MTRVRAVRLIKFSMSAASATLPVERAMRMWKSASASRNASTSVPVGHNAESARARASASDSRPSASMASAASAALSASRIRRTASNCAALPGVESSARNPSGLSRRPGSSSVTYVPSPCRVSRTPRWTRARTPSRSDPRDTPSFAASSFSIGRREPGPSTPSRTSRLISWITTSVCDGDVAGTRSPAVREVIRPL